MPDQRARRLGSRRSERPRRIHAHLVQRLRDRRREPVRRRAAPHLGAHSGVRPVHRPGAGPRRDERGRGPQERQAGAGGEDADGAREPGARGGRDAGLHESAGRRRLQGAAGRLPPRPKRRRGRPFAARRDVREKTLHHDPARRAHPSHGERADPHPARHPRTAPLGAGAALARYLRLRLAAAQRRDPLQLALDRAESEIDQRRQLVLDVAHLLLLFYRQVMMGRDPHLDHHAVAVALVMLALLAREAKAANVDLEIQVYPGASLFKPNEQWNALVNGQLDISSFPLDYASGKVRAFGATLMPGLVRSHERAQRLNNSPFMKEIKAHIDKAGVVVLADAWLAGAIASKKGCIRRPEDIKGLKVRSAGPTFASMWQSAGASIVSIPSNEVYNALQTGVADATDTSSASFVSFRIYEQVKCLTAPGDNALWFMYEPVLMSKKTFLRLNRKQQGALLQAGRKSQQYFAANAKGLDDEMVKVFKDHKVAVLTLTTAAE